MFWRTLVLTVLWLEAFAETTVKITEKDSIYNTTFDTSQGSIELRIDKRTLEDVRHGYLVIYPISDHSYEIRAGNKGEEKLRCIGNHHSVCVLSLDEEEHPVVRHEAILSFYDITKDEAFVDQFFKHPNQLIRESVELASKMGEEGT